MTEGTMLLTIEVNKVTFKKDRFAIVKAALYGEAPGGDDQLPDWVTAKEFTVKGNFDGAVGPADIFDCEVKVERHPRYGPQFTAVTAQRSVAADERALASFLRGFPQVGKQRAKAIIKRFGGFEGVLAVLRDEPARLSEVDGITEERAEAIAWTYRSLSAQRAVLELGRRRRLPSWLVSRVLDRTTVEGTAERLEADPYRLMDYRVDFATVDALAREQWQMPRDDPRRLSAGAYVLLEAAASEGHVWSLLEDLLESEDYGMRRARKTVTLSGEELLDGFGRLAEEEAPRAQVVRDRWALTRLARAEERLAGRLRHLLHRTTHEAA